MPIACREVQHFKLTINEKAQFLQALKGIKLMLLVRYDYII